VTGKGLIKFLISRARTHTRTRIRRSSHPNERVKVTLIRSEISLLCRGGFLFARALKQSRFSRLGLNEGACPLYKAELQRDIISKQARGEEASR